MERLIKQMSEVTLLAQDTAEPWSKGHTSQASSPVAGSRGQEGVTASAQADVIKHPSNELCKKTGMSVSYDLGSLRKGSASKSY